MAPNPAFRILRLGVLGAFGVIAGETRATAEPSVAVLAVKGDVRARGPKAKSYEALSKGQSLAEGTRVRTGDDGEATLRFPDTTETTVRAKSEIIVHAASPARKQPSAVVLFFGRLWAHAAKASGAEQSFEVRSANAVAGVRGTKFEVGVADNGSTRVIVSEGAVEVGGDTDGQPVNVSSGFEVETSGEGRLADRKKAPDNPDWEGWFTKRAKELEKQGLKVARALDGRLSEKKAKVERLLKEQRDLRQQIERLEKSRKGGPELEALASKLEKTTARLEDMKRRLQGAFGMFERWSAVAKGGRVEAGEQIEKMAADVAKIAADFGDMIEEGTDLSEDGMNDMMDDMRKGKGGKPKKSAKDELF